MSSSFWVTSTKAFTIYIWADLENKLQKGRQVCVLLSLLYAKHSGQCSRHSECSDYMLKEWMNICAFEALGIDENSHFQMDFLLSLTFTPTPAFRPPQHLGSIRNSNYFLELLSLPICQLLNISIYMSSRLTCKNTEKLNPSLDSYTSP